jgi:hypothetical protein
MCFVLAHIAKSHLVELIHATECSPREDLGVLIVRNLL